MCVWVKCEPNGTWRLCTCIKIELKEKCAGTPKTWSLLPKQISYVVNLKLKASLSMQRYEDMTRYDEIWKDMIWQDTIRYVEVCLSLSLDDSLSGGSSSTCSGASASRRLTIRGLVLWESNRGNVRENGEITVAQCLVDPRWPKKWHWCMDVAKHY